MKHLMQEKYEAIELQTQQEFLTSILSITQNKLAFMLLEKEVHLERLMKLGGESNLNLVHCLKFWINVSQNTLIKAALVKKGLPITLYKNLRVDNPSQSNVLIKTDLLSEEELALSVELIKQLISGQKEQEKELA
mmetsp:Transcript_9034/g.8492  ORF Transcript_9034/g.8492 Transcript_9034/m.8492 type:complete len:135 (-) Transcript_9034:2154-2558(-)